MPNVKYLSLKTGVPPNLYWDQTLLNDILQKVENYDIPEDGQIIIFPGAYQADCVKELNEYIKQYQWVILFITSDEESKFPVEQIEHPNIKIYVQYPKKGRHDDYGKWPLGYVPKTRENLYLNEKKLDYFFSGQVTHSRRQDCINGLLLCDDLDGVVNVTDGFTKGLDHIEYMQFMNSAKTAPAPSGPISADSFRTYEALEAGAVPLADNKSNAGDVDYWKYLFGSVPFPTIDEYEFLKGHMTETLDLFPVRNNRVQAWWLHTKWMLRQEILFEIERLSGKSPKITEDVTVIIPVSPIKSHPNITILRETIESIKYHLPTAEIIITFDGVRAEQEDKRKDYEEFIRRCLFHCNTDWNALPLIFEDHTHQVGMAKKAMQYVKTPLILYCEQDTPLVTDLFIDWYKCKEKILSGDANVIRFHFEAFIPKEHEHLVFPPPIDDFLPTIQWSQRPHLAFAQFYRMILHQYFTDDAKCFIEDKMHGIVFEQYHNLGLRALDAWKILIYHPEGGNIKRSLHSDGRDGEQKYDDTQVW